MRKTDGKLLQSPLNKKKKKLSGELDVQILFLLREMWMKMVMLSDDIFIDNFLKKTCGKALEEE